MRKGTPTVIRFFDKVEITDSDKCWHWTGASNPTGHGRFYVSRALSSSGCIPAHRWAWEWYHEKPIPEGLHLDHLCEQPSCVNPLHLKPVTLTENLYRSGRALAMINRAKTHCPRGHAYDEENTHINTNGARVCRACRRRS